MAKFKISNYQGIKIDCWTAKDLVGLHHLMKQEGCQNSENLFSDTDKAIELDDVQRRIPVSYTHLDLQKELAGEGENWRMEFLALGEKSRINLLRLAIHHFAIRS